MVQALSVFLSLWRPAASRVETTTSAAAAALATTVSTYCVCEYVRARVLFAQEDEERLDI
jgi:hypothetical protein